MNRIVISRPLDCLVCKNEKNTIQDCVVIKAIKRRRLPEEREYGTDNLIVESDELFLHKRLSEQYLDRNSFIKFRTNSYHHSKRSYPHKLYVE
jgi:hypothetical protein